MMLALYRWTAGEHRHGDRCARYRATSGDCAKCRGDEVPCRITTNFGPEGPHRSLTTAAASDHSSSVLESRYALPATYCCHSCQDVMLVDLRTDGVGTQLSVAAILEPIAIYRLRKNSGSRVGTVHPEWGFSPGEMSGFRLASGRILTHNE